MCSALELYVDTFFWNWKFSAFHDLDRCFRTIARVLGNILYLLNNVIAFKHLAEDVMTAIEPTAHIKICIEP